VNCAAAAAIMELAGKTSARGHDVAAAARAFWPRRSSNRRWLAHEIVQQPVKPFRQKSANVMKCLILLVVYDFSLSASNGQPGLKIPGKVYCTVLHIGEGPGANFALFSGRQWSLNGARRMFSVLPG
jgi:hypothetical protein